MKYVKYYNINESENSGTLSLSKTKVFSLIRLIVKAELKEINNSAGKLEIVYAADSVDVSSIFPHMKKAAFEYRTLLNTHWAEAEIKTWDSRDINNRRVYTLSTGKYKRKTNEYQSMIHIFMKHLIDSGKEIKY